MSHSSLPRLPTDERDRLRQPSYPYATRLATRIAPIISCPGLSVMSKAKTDGKIRRDLNTTFFNAQKGLGNECIILTFGNRYVATAFAHFS
jgi:hypothetical protein